MFSYRMGPSSILVVSDFGLKMLVLGDEGEGTAQDCNGDWSNQLKDDYVIVFVEILSRHAINKVGEFRQQNQSAAGNQRNRSR